MARWHSCNVLRPGADTRHLWQFNVAGGKFHLAREEEKLRTEKLNEKAVAKDWQSLFQPRLNVAWLPSDKVFLRAVQLPKGDAAELQSMVEFQLEKLSPLPVAQIVWTYERLDQVPGDMQTVIVTVVSRNVVEEFLGQLEGQGYLADRIEVPLLDQIRATKIHGDGVWIYPGLGLDGSGCLVAWWYGGVLCELALLYFPPTEERGKLLQEQLMQMTWSGELQGWLTSSPQYHVVADGETITAWNLPFAPDEIIAPLPRTELAALTARRAAKSNGVAGLMPLEFTRRYRQQFIDRLWMRGLGAVILAYLVLAGLYILWVQYADWRHGDLRRDVAAAGLSYTNALQIKERVRVLQDQMDLQWAALDCYNAVAQAMPTELTLESMSFDGGRRLALTGTAASSEDREKVLDFSDALRKAMAREQLLFKSVEAPRLTTQAGGAALNWSFGADLKRTDTP